MAKNEEIRRELLNAGLVATEDVSHVLRGEIILADDWSRWYIYLSNQGDSWGAFSEDHFISEEAADAMVRLLPGIRRGKQDDRDEFFFGKPYFVIASAKPQVLATFVIIVQVLAATDPGVLERRMRRTKDAR